MAELIIYYKGCPVLREHLAHNLSIGSDQESDISLIDSVLPRHARIEVTPEKMLLIECEGKIFANGEPIAGSKTLEEGDFFEIGAYRFQVLESRGGTKTARVGGVRDGDSAESTIPTIHFSSPVQKSFKRAHLLIGRSSSCDLVINNPFVSSKHAELFVREGQYLIRDLHSRNGTYVNDLKITERPLSSSGIIRFGQFPLPYQVEFNLSLCRDEEKGLVIPGRNHGDPQRSIIGTSPIFQSLIANLKKIAVTDDSVLLLGETGVGKELLAQYLHFGHPKRKTAPFVAINCATIPPNLIESQLFGHVRGSFTGATSDYAGFFRQAHRGTLFLDEIGELPVEGQARLLRVVEDSLVRPVGGERNISVDVRFVFATNRNLETERIERHFREDLYQRFDWILTIPPLRERVEDIPLLVRYFMTQHAPFPLSIDAYVVTFLQSLPWKGNIRELNKVIRRAITNAVSRGSSILQKEDFDISPDRLEKKPTLSKSGQMPGFSTSMMRTMKRTSLAETLSMHQGNVTMAAKALGISRITMYEWLKLEGIDLSSFRK